MDKFIALSDSSKELLKIAHMSLSLPVNVLILGESGVGRKLLACEVLPNAQSFDARKLETLISHNKIDLKQFNSLIVYDINKVLNKTEFLDNLKELRIVATSYPTEEDYVSQFAVKLDIPPLSQREEDLNELKKLYIQEAKKVYSSSLKHSIYKSILLKSMTKEEMMDTLYDFFVIELNGNKSYKQFLEIFEIPLLKAAKKVYKSQLQMAKKLHINRITLRKKLSRYFDER
jgi:DNA-binding NtrC family response regulator